MMNIGTRVECVNPWFTSIAKVGDKATVVKFDGDFELYGSEYITVDFDNGYKGYTWKINRFKVLKEEQTMLKPGDTVKVKGCTSAKARYNGMTGIIIGNEEYWNDEYPHSICFDGTGQSCGWLFADHELEVIPQFAVGDKVTVMAGNNALEFVDGTLTSSNSVKYEVGIGTDIAIYKITGEFKDDTIIRRISDGRVFFVQQRFLKKYVAVPKFSVGKIVVYQGIFFKVLKVDDGLLYTISGYNDGRHAHDDIKESELSEVAQ